MRAKMFQTLVVDSASFAQYIVSLSLVMVLEIVIKPKAIGFVSSHNWRTVELILVTVLLDILSVIYIILIPVLLDRDL